MGASAQMLDTTTDTMKKMAIGASAAVISKSATAPLERVKLLMQVQSGGQVAINHYNGMADCFARIASNEGVLALWRGNVANVIKCVPTHPLNIVLRDYYRGYLLRGIAPKDHYKYFGSSLLAGGLAGATALALLYPLDFARTRMAIEQKINGTKPYKNWIDCLLQTKRTDGMRVWYRGFSSALFHTFISRAVFFGMFDTARTYHSEDQKNMSFTSTFCLSMACLVFSTALCHPIDTVRRRLMMAESTSNGANPKTIALCKQILKNEGCYSLYKGGNANMLRSVSGALIISLYYEISKYI